MNSEKLPRVKVNQKWYGIILKGDKLDYDWGSIHSWADYS
jgi:hypothetical protein